MDRMNIHKKYTAIHNTSLAEKGRWLIFALTVLQLVGCVKDELYNTPHPDKGAVQVTTDWTGRSSDALLPTEHILRIGSEEQTVKSETNVFKSLFLPGTQSLLIYHQAEGISINGTTATINTLEDGTLNPMPGFLFSAAKELTIQKDDTLKVTVPMTQRIRTLVLTLKLNSGDEQRITSTTSTLTDGYVQTITTDLTEALKNFGGDIKPLELDATLELPADGNFDGTISGWDVKDDLTIDAD